MKLPYWFYAMGFVTCLIIIIYWLSVCGGNIWIC